MLSNTATPKYYGMFREAVRSGQIPVNYEISLEMNRIDKLIENPKYYYDENAMDGFVRFCEAEMTLTDGSDLELIDTFKLWAEQIFCWYYFIDIPVWEPGHPGRWVYKHKKKRLTKKQFLVIARGAAKTMYDAMIQGYFVTVDTTTTQQITTAPTMTQAEEVMNPIRTAITRARGPLMKFLTQGSLQNTTGDRALRQKLCSTKKGIQNFMTNSIIEVKPMTINKLQGYKPKVTTVDEWLSGDIREDVIGAIEQGASKNDDYIIVATSSEGCVRNGAGDDIKMELMQILRGEYYAPHVSIWYYKLDDVKEVADPDMWVKANPNLGKTISYEAYHEDVERAERIPAARNDILAKRFGLPMEGYTYFFRYQETLPHRKQTYHGMPCSLGADLSQGDDFCAFAALFKLGEGVFGVKSRCYITRRNYLQLGITLRQKYDEFINEDTLVVMDDPVIDTMKVYDDLEHWFDQNEYDPISFGYDPYNAKDFVARWVTEHGPWGVEKVIQGAKTESVPLGEMKQLAEDRNLVFDEQIFSFAMGNCITIEDTNGNRKLLKIRQDRKIDPVAACMDAYVAFKLNRESFE